MSSNGRTILGIDPGLQRTGWGLIHIKNNSLTFMAAGVLTSNTKEPLASRLAMLNEKLSTIITLHQPGEAAIEETFVSVNGASTLKLGQARGAILLTLAMAGLDIGEYAPNTVKKSITGSGHADKTQLAAMVRMLLPTCDVTQPDATDALAIAICHAHHRM